MSVSRTGTGLVAVARGLLFIRLRSLGSLGTALQLLAVFAALFGLGLLSVGRDDVYGFWKLAVTLFMNGFLPLFCLAKGGEAVRGSLKDGTIEYLWTRPVRRGQLYFGFFLGSLVSTLAFVVACLCGLTLVALVRGIDLGIVGIAVMWLEAFVAAAAFTAISMALAAYSSKFVALGVFYFLVVELGIGNLPTKVSSVSIGAQAREAMRPMREIWAGAAVEMQVFGPAFSILSIGLIALVIGAGVFVLSGYVVGDDKDG